MLALHQRVSGFQRQGLNLGRSGELLGELPGKFSGSLGTLGEPQRLLLKSTVRGTSGEVRGNFGGEKKPININKFSGLSRNGWGSDWLMCCLFQAGKWKHIHKILRKMPGQSRDNPGIIPGQSREAFVYVFSCLLVWFGCFARIIIHSERSSGEELLGKFEEILGSPGAFQKLGGA